MSSLISKLGKQRAKIVARKTNNELSALPGFFFRPQDRTGLEELSYEDRCQLMINQGDTVIGMFMHIAKADTEGKLANARIPTHRRPGVPIPKYGAVSFDLRGVIEVK